MTVGDLIKELKQIKNKKLLVKATICREFVDKEDGHHVGFEGCIGGDLVQEGFVGMTFDPDDCEYPELCEGAVELSCFTGEQVPHTWKVTVSVADKSISKPKKRKSTNGSTKTQVQSR